MEKKIYSQKFEWNKTANILIIGMITFFWIFFMIVGIFGGMDLPSILLICVCSFLLLYFILFSYISVRKNKFEVYEKHIEINVFKLFVMRKYNLTFDEIDLIHTPMDSGWSIVVELKNKKKIRIFGNCLPQGKGSYYESKKLLNAVKKVGL